MSNHSDRPDREMSEHFRKLFPTQSLEDRVAGELQRMTPIGATQRHPEGKLTTQDKGELAFRVGAKDGKVVIEFHEPMHWLGMTPEQAIELAGTLIRRARSLGTKHAVSIEL